MEGAVLTIDLIGLNDVCYISTGSTHCSDGVRWSIGGAVDHCRVRVRWSIGGAVDHCRVRWSSRSL